MKRILLLGLFSLRLIASAGGNLVRNGDVRGPGNWDNTGESGFFACDDEVGATKPGSLRIHSDYPDHRTASYWSQRIELPKKVPKRLKLSVALLTREFTPSAQAYVVAQVFPDKGDAIARAFADRLTSDGEWRTTRAVFDVPENARYVQLLACLIGGGTVWFDDFALEETDEPVTPREAGDPLNDGANEKLARGCVADLPWCFTGEQARARAAKESKPVLIYVRCTDSKGGVPSARKSIEAADIPMQDDGYVKDLLFRAGPLSNPDIRDLIARRTVALCATYLLSESTRPSDLPPYWEHSAPVEGVRFSVDKREGSTKPGSLCIESSGQDVKATHEWFQAIALPRELPAMGRLSACVRVQDSVSPCEAKIDVECWNGEGPMAGGGYLNVVRSDTKWSSWHSSIQIPSGAKSVSIHATFTGHGTVWFDDLSIETKGEHGKAVDLVQNGGLDVPAETFEGFEITPAELTTPALVLADAKGKVLRKLQRLGTLSDDLVDHWLRTALADAGFHSNAREPEALFRDGELDKLISSTPNATRPDVQLLRARAFLRMGGLDDASRELGSIEGGAADSIRGWIAMRRGSWSLARSQFDAAAKDLEGEAQQDASFWSAWSTAMLGAHSAAAQQWNALVGATLTGRRAAACVLAQGPRPMLAISMRAWPRLAKLPEQSEGDYTAQFDLARSTSALLEMQCDDGSFSDHQGPEGRGAFDPAITAIAVDALAAVESKLAIDVAERARAARKRASSYLLEYAAHEQPCFHAMESFDAPRVLQTLLRQHEQSSCKQLVARIVSLQFPDGSWSIFNAERATSFDTASCVLALQSANYVGVAAPADALQRGIAALERMRAPDNLFRFSTAAADDWMTTKFASIARDAQCEHALLAVGRGSPQLLAASLERFLEFHKELRAPTKRLGETVDDRGHGSFDFFLAHFAAFEAARAFAPPELTRRIAAASREAVLSAMEGDGTWLDNFERGRAYGTAMALLALNRP
jgi:hypothetical protein